MFTRHAFLTGLGATFLTGLSVGGYAFGMEPMRLRIQTYAVNPPGWPSGLKLKVAALADIHACRPWMSPERIAGIVSQTNALDPDLVVLLGDYVAGHRWVTGNVDASEWAEALSGLSAPLGVHAILGNHDWWSDEAAQISGSGPVPARRALEEAGVPVYENNVTRIEKGDHAFWLAGLGDQLAFLPRARYGRTNWQGVDDLPGTLAQITDDAPVLLMVHEPDIFTQVPDRVSLTLAGHTHGGQVRVLGYSPVVPSRFRNRYAYGHVVEPGFVGPGAARHIIVSGGLGCTIMPARFGVPPEIVVVDVGGQAV